MTDASPSVISVENLSKWYGSVVAVNDVSFEIQPGVTGLLGPNGAGKTTLLKMIEGLSDPSDGEVSIFGQTPRGNPDLYRRVGVMSEHEAVYGFYTGREFVEFSAKLHGVTDVSEAADLAIERAGMTEAQGRKLGGYSRGMRQRMRLAAAMVHQPEVLILDEPLNGTDPRQRIEFHDLMRQLASEGKTILISSHILEEVETLADRILLMVSGKLAASGDYRAIRAKLDEQPYTVRVVSDSPRAIASALVEMDGIESVSMAEDGEVVVLSKNVEVLQRSVARVAQRARHTPPTRRTPGRVARKRLQLHSGGLDGTNLSPNPQTAPRTMASSPDRISRVPPHAYRPPRQVAGPRKCRLQPGVCRRHDRCHDNRRYPAHRHHDRGLRRLRKRA